jgi:hypothetical protein
MRRFLPTQPNSFSEEDASPALTESRRLLYEFVRHISTLSTASLVVTTAFIEKVFVAPVAKAAVGIAVLSFLISLFFGGFGYLMFPQSPSTAWNIEDDGFGLALSGLGARSAPLGILSGHRCPCLFLSKQLGLAVTSL